MLAIANFTGRLAGILDWLLPFLNLGGDTPLESLLVIAQFVDTLEHMFEVLTHLLMLLAVLTVINLEHLLIMVPVIGQVASQG